jgi:hypothetical protein
MGAREMIFSLARRRADGNKKAADLLSRFLKQR